MGAKGFLLKNVASSDLISSLRALDRGEMAVSRVMMSHVMREFAQMSPGMSGDGKDAIDRLSPREIDVLCELESGASNADIAQRLFLSENTVKHHIRNVFEKLDIGNRHQAAVVARRFGLRGKNSALLAQ